QPGRPAGRAVDKVRAADQPQDREGARPDDPANAARGRRRDHRMRRRAFISLLVGASSSSFVSWPLAARAQQPKVPVVGYFSSRRLQAEEYLLQFFRKGLEVAGCVTDQNAGMELRFAAGHEARLPALAANLVSRRVSVLVASDTPSALAAKAATATIPIVF